MSPAARVLLPYVRRQWKALAGAGGATVVQTAADLAKPWPLAIVVDHVLGRTAPFALEGADWRLLIGVAVLVLVIALAEAAALYLSNLWLQTAGERISHELRIAVYDHLQRLSLAFHQKRQKGDLLTRVTGDVNAMGDLFAQSLGTIAQAGLLAAGMTVVLLVIDPVLALVSLATTPALLGISWVYRRRVRTTAKVRRAHEGRIASMAGEALSAMAVVKAFGSERVESDRVRAGSEQRMAVGVDIARLQASFDGLVGAVRAIGTAFVLVVGVMRVASGALSPGELLVFVSYTRKAYSPLKSLARESTKVAATMAKADRIAEILSADDVLEDGTYRGARAAGDVALERVSFAYDRERPVLRDVSLRIAAGTSVALVGPSGAGKSTLGALVARFHDPIEGRVLIDGRDARDCTLEWLRAQVAIVLQDTVLFTGTVRENIAYGTGADGRGDRRRRPRRRRARVHPRAAAGLRHRAGPAGRRAVRGPAPADRRRAHAAARPADPAARRADDGARRRQRGGAARRPADADARPHHRARDALAAAGADGRPRRAAGARPGERPARARPGAAAARAAARRRGDGRGAGPIARPAARRRDGQPRRLQARRAWSPSTTAPAPATPSPRPSRASTSPSARGGRATPSGRAGSTAALPPRTR